MEDICHERELEFFFLRKELDKTISQSNTNLRFEKRSIVLADILNFQRSPFERTGLGYNNNHKNTDFEIPERREKTQSYANILMSSNKQKEEENNLDLHAQRNASQ
jgi:hypothetical protein